MLTSVASSVLAPGPRQKTVAPSPTVTAVLGMARTSLQSDPTIEASLPVSRPEVEVEVLFYTL